MTNDRTFKVGDIVTYDAQFLQLANRAGAHPPSWGKVTGVDSETRGEDDPVQQLTIEWNDGSGSTTSARIIVFSHHITDCARCDGNGYTEEFNLYRGRDLCAHHPQRQPCDTCRGTGRLVT